MESMFHIMLPLSCDILFHVNNDEYYDASDLDKSMVMHILIVQKFHMFICLDLWYNIIQCSSHNMAHHFCREAAT